MTYGNVSWKNKADGWVAVTDEELLAVLKNTSVCPWEISAYGGDVIVPTWVIDSVKQYKTEGGFAGMALFEYLDKMSNERVEEPAHSF